MTCLPLIERELRVRARNRGFYRLRLGVGVVGGLICWQQMVVPRSSPLSSMGQSVFDGLAGAAFIVCCSACLWTADVISSEKREGTLGLLFLTRVTELDLLLGKFGSAGLTGLCALTAFLPMMMIPVLAGGVTGGEAFRKALVLLATLFLALAAGMYESVTHRARSGAVWRTMALLSALVLLPYLATRLGGFSQSGLGLISPLCGLEFAGDFAYKSSPANYWVCLGITNASAWMLATGAGFHLRRGVRDAEVGGEAALVEGVTPRAWSRGRTVGLPDGANPVEWLVRRQRALGPIFWVAASISAAHNCSYWLFPQTLMRGAPFARIGYWAIQLPGLAAACLTYGLFAWGASRFVMQARMSGELELLLTTRLTSGAFISGQWNALRSLVAAPVTVMIIMSWVMHIYPAGLSGPPNLGLLEHVVPVLLNSLHTLLSVACLSWLAMDLGLRSPTQSDVIRRALLMVILVPLAIDGAAAMLFSPLLRGFFQIWFQAHGIVAYRLILLPQQLLVIAYFVWLSRRARRRLASSLKRADPASFTLRFSR